MEEEQVRNIVKKVLDEEHLFGFVKIFEKEHNLFRGSHDKIGLPEALVIHQTIVNQIIDNIEDDAITMDQLADGTTYGRVVLSALSEGLILLSGAAGSLDDIADGTYAKILAASLSSGQALLSEAAGSLDNIANGATYGRILLADLSGGHILLGTVEGDLDDVDDGTSYGKILLTDISAGHILLASVEGDLDDVDDGTTYAKILATDISAGHILLSEAVGELPISKFANLPSDEDLVGYWSFDDGTGTVAIDGSGRGNDGALQNMEEGDWVDGKVGNALDFDGDNDWIELPTNAFGTGPVSMVFWIKTTETLERIPLTIEGAWSFKVGRGGSNNKIGVTFTGSSADMIDSTSVINDDEWHFVVATHDETTARLYIDGSEENSATQSPYNIDGLSRVSAIGGQYNGSFNINALIDEVRIYKTVLTAAEIKALYLYPAGNKGVYGMVQITDISAGHILLASCDGDLDDISDGTYGKVLSTDISSGHILLTECTGDLDDVADGGTYGKVALTDISSGHILLAECSGDLDDLDDGSTYGKILLTDISSGHILLAECSGDLDDVADGSNYGKVALTSISAGKIVVAGFDADALARIFTDGDAQVDIEAWRHGLDATLIDGGKIYAQSITASEILAGTITADEIFANTITIGEISSGTILLEMFTDFFTSAVDGNDPWVGALFGGSLQPKAGEINHPGIVTFASNLTNQGCRFLTATNCIMIAGGEYSEFCFRGNSVLNIRVRLGYQDSTTATLPTDGIYLYLEGTTLTGICRDNGSESETSSYTISTGTWYRGTIVVNSDATLVTFTLYNAAGTELWSRTEADDIPTGASRQTGHGALMYVGANVARSVDVDMMLATYSGELTR